MWSGTRPGCLLITGEQPALFTRSKSKRSRQLVLLLLLPLLLLLLLLLLVQTEQHLPTLLLPTTPLAVPHEENREQCTENTQST